MHAAKQGHMARKLTPERVRFIRTERERGRTQQAIADEVGVSQALVSDILLGYIWSHVH